ncbi:MULTISPECIES: CDP-alcohol phosphatidyltransferase family protein [Ferroplasma]|jgi:archaetidylinositol phosphate synthase|uniref:CDP-diacylglycerol-glycerol-3-phosphate 3-phosphatidyltransferase n=2 Tax=Ferroplasma TaxID=74968 RepID=S0AS15_FERAC|nr:MULTISPECIES: CDP-alcohol phosphatidyltransferase family protein [Ferroplasma]MCL4349641.1 CDP-alcohol phosphatidyltransferase family protein [Candidatus Thermoplasmatota archaeon]AGO61602.1 CDP-diacylglycerol-glycerol-3-phosphate 3-phosphatidyltransferase [Ferroplasma acidarmanus Fer1]ARD84512.1 CDP-diacylglycerol--glycerol-3-phosphate 3-phosphatidyltransferase [Ferroplasma acidiphilum]NOL61169.1 CDP-alcohol phosphatidyltransferase family protein [Ferroplasma acidiphilum]WMT53442.1 MAG: CD
MVLDSYRKKADRFLDPITKKFSGINPNTISILSLVFAALAGIFYYLSHYFLLLAFIFIIFSALFDALDGKIARLKNISSKKGDMLDHVFDRYSDMFIILGMTFSIYGNVYFGLFAILGILLTSYMGTQSQALGLKRNYSGIAGRADRLILIIIFSLIQFFVSSHFSIYSIDIYATGILLIWFGLAGNITAITRFFDMYKNL